MPGSAQQKAQNASIAQNNQYGSQANQRAGQLYGIDMGQLQGILAHPGYTPAQEAQMNRQMLGGIGASYGSALQSAKSTAAATNNSAGLVGLQDKLAQQKAQTVAQGEANLGVTEANDAQGQQMQALQMLGGLYGQNMGLLGQTLGNNAGTARAYAPGTLQQILGGVAGVGGALGSAYLNNR